MVYALFPEFLFDPLAGDAHAFVQLLEAFSHTCYKIDPIPDILPSCILGKLLNGLDGNYTPRTDPRACPADVLVLVLGPLLEALQKPCRIQGDGYSQVLGALELGLVPLLAELDELVKNGLQVVWCIYWKPKGLRRDKNAAWSMKTHGLTLRDRHILYTWSC